MLSESFTVDMAEMAKERATHQELEDLADDIIAAPTAEMDRMRRWLKDWYGREVDEDHTWAMTTRT